jgi:hypothetical protein
MKIYRTLFLKCFLYELALQQEVLKFKARELRRKVFHLWEKHLREVIPQEKSSFLVENPLPFCIIHQFKNMPHELAKSCWLQLSVNTVRKEIELSVIDY